MPQPIGAPPLAALKQWLGISLGHEDALLERLLLAAYETCGQFTGPDVLAEDWAEVRPALAEGIIRFAAHLYRSREGENGREPPASVAALWRPWRRVGL